MIKSHCCVKGLNENQYGWNHVYFILVPVFNRGEFIFLFGGILYEDHFT